MLRRSDGDVTLELISGRVDQDALPLNLINSRERIVAVHGVGYAEWDTARLKMRMRVPDVAESERGWRDMRAAVAISNRSSNFRAVTPLHREADGTWTGDVRIDHADHKGRTQLSGIVTATVGDVPGRIIGAPQETWIVDLDARTAHREQELRVVETDFGNDAHPHLHDFRQSEWTIDAGGEMPTVYVNTAVEGVSRILRAPTRGMSPAERALQKALAAKLGTEIWVTLFNTAVDEIRVEDGEPHWPGGWRDAVLRHMLPDVYPDRSPDDAVRELAARRNGIAGGTDLHARVLHAAGRRARSARSLGEAVREATKGSVTT